MVQDNKNKAKSRRLAELAKIHIAKKQLGMDDETYRAALKKIVGVTSAAKLTAGGRERVIEYFKQCGFKTRKGERPFAPTPRKEALKASRPRNAAQPACLTLLLKIENMLYFQWKTWAYSDGIARQMFTKNIDECRPEELKKIVAALVYQGKRNARK
jgi:phage gp16-like protein